MARMARLIFSVETSQTWLIPALKSHVPPAMLERLAECQSGFELDANGALRAISAAELEQRFTSILAGEPSLTVWPNDLERWHLERAAALERRAFGSPPRFTWNASWRFIPRTFCSSNVCNAHVRSRTSRDGKDFLKLCRKKTSGKK